MPVKLQLLFIPIGMYADLILSASFGNAWLVFIGLLRFQPCGGGLSGAVAGYEGGYFALDVSGNFDGAEEPSLYEFVMAC